MVMTPYRVEIRLNTGALLYAKTFGQALASGVRSMAIASPSATRMGYGTTESSVQRIWASAAVRD